MSAAKTQATRKSAAAISSALATCRVQRGRGGSGHASGSMTCRWALKSGSAPKTAQAVMIPTKTIACSSRAGVPSTPGTHKGMPAMKISPEIRSPLSHTDP